MRYLLLAATIIVCAQVAHAQAPKVDEKAVGKVIAESLKDPDSLRLRNVRLNAADEPNTWHLCGEYNAKNEFGGYQGFQHFVGSATRSGKGLVYIVRDAGDFARSFCTAQP